MRHDYLVNLLQTLLETLFFYHPAMWWISHRIRFERECCCDDLAIRAIGNVTTYGRALLAVEELRGLNPSLAIGADGGSLKCRIRRMTESPSVQQKVRSSNIVAGLVIVVTLVAVLFSVPAQSKQSQVQADIPVPGESQTSKPNDKPVPEFSILTSSGAQLSDGVRINLVHVGFPAASRPRSWNSDRQGLVKLEGLENGHHTLIAQLDQLNATTLPIEIPLSFDMKPVRLRAPSRGLEKQDAQPLEIQTRVVTRGGNPIILIDVVNRSNESVSLTRNDFSLRNNSLRVFPPTSLVEFDRILLPKSTTSIALDWNLLVEQGLWISEPGEQNDELLPNSDLEKDDSETEMQFAHKLAEVRQVEYQKAIQANRILPGIIADPEIKRLKRAWEQAEFRLGRELFIASVGGTDSEFIALPQPAKILAERKLLRKTSTPDATSIIVNYNIAGAEEQGQIFVQQIGGRDVIGTEGFEPLKWNPVKNGGTLNLKDIGFGKYQVARYRQVDGAKAGMGRMQLGMLLDRRQFTLETGETITINYTRPKGRPLTGKVLRLKELGLESAVVMICSGKAFNPDSRDLLNVTTFDARACLPDGTFQTEALEAGDYVISVQGFEPIIGFQSGRARARFVAIERISITADQEIKPVNLTLLDTTKPEDQFRLKCLTSIRLSVLDSTGKKGIPQFRVIPGHRVAQDEKKPPKWQTELARPGQAGDFLWPLEDLDEKEWAFKIEADGYEPQVWTWIRKAEGPQHLFFMLIAKPGTSPKAPDKPESKSKESTKPDNPPKAQE